MVNKNIKNAKDTMKLGIGSMAGMGAIGAMSTMPGMPKNNVAGIASAGIGLANVGQLSKTGMDLAGSMGSSSKKSKLTKHKMW